MMREPDPNKPHNMYFQQRYVTTDFNFRNTEISFSDKARKMDFLLRKRVAEDDPNCALLPGDGFLTVTCERDMAERIYCEALSSGQLSIKKGAVGDVSKDIHTYILRTVR